MLKSICTGLFLLLYSIQLEAAIPKNASAAFKEVRKRYKEVKTFQCTFREVFQWKMTGETNERSGRIIIADNVRFRIETPEQLIVCDGTSLYRYNVSRNQVMIEPVKEAEQMLPRKILIGFAEDFDETAMSPLAVDGSEGFRLDLKSKNPEEELIAEASLWVNAADFSVRRIQLIDLNGNSTGYFLQDIIFDAQIPPEKMKFDLPDNAELFDLR